MPRTLIVYLHGIGDNIMLTGVLKEYCRQRPEECIDLVVLNPGCAAIWKNNPLVKTVTIYPDHQPYFWNPAKFYLLHQWKVRRYIRELNRAGRYQRVLFPTIQTLPEIVYHLTGAYGRHKIERLSHDMGVPTKLYPYDLHVSPDDAAEAGKWLQKFSGSRLAVLHPFSGHAKKCISNDGFGKILEALGERGLATLVVGAPDEKSRFDPGWKTESAFGLSFGVLIEVLKRAEIFAGTDSAVAHLAAFANTPHIVILSPKLEPRRYLPVSEHGRISLVHIRQNREPENLAEFFAVLAAR
jgi:ADP-heptose:LPS heptosyltransferase